MASLLLSPDAVIRFKGGRAAVHNPYSPAPAIETDDTAVIAFIARFAVAQDPFDALRSLPAGSRPVAEQLVGQLVQAKVLVPGAVPAASAEGSRGETLTSLRVLGRSAALLAEDLVALGLDAGPEVAMAGLALPRRLFSVLAAIDALREEVKTLRAAVQAQQLQAVAARHGASGLRLHIAQAAPRVEGWINLRSRPPADVALNPAWGLPFDAGAAQSIYAMDAIERLPGPEETRFFLGDARRVLMPGGCLRLAVAAPPGTDPAARLIALLKECGFGSSQASTHMGSARQELRLEEMSGLAAAAPRIYLEALA